MGLLAFWAAAHFIPYSIDGPAMSCWTAQHELKSDEAVRQYATASDGDFEKVIRYLINSDFELVGASIDNQNTNIINLGFKTNYSNSSCILTNVMQFDGSITRIKIKKEKSSKIEILEIW